MTRGRLAVRLVCATLIVAATAVSLVASAQEVIRTGRPVSTGGPIVQLTLVIIVVASLYVVIRVRGYLDETRPPRNAVMCSACGNHAAAFDRRCRRCGARLDQQAASIRPPGA